MSTTDEALKLAAKDVVACWKDPKDYGDEGLLRLQMAIDQLDAAIKPARSTPLQEPTDVWFNKCFRSDPPAQPAPAVPAPLTDDVRGLLVIEHLGPNALLHKPMSIYEAFHMGIDAAEAAHGITKAVKTALQP